MLIWLYSLLFGVDTNSVLSITNVESECTTRCAECEQQRGGESIDSTWRAKIFAFRGFVMFCMLRWFAKYLLNCGRVNIYKINLRDDVLVVWKEGFNEFQ